jgi:hypothetical protein
VTDEERAEGFKAATIGWAVDWMEIEDKIDIERGSPETFRRSEHSAIAPRLRIGRSELAPLV